ncbi:MAG: hypothetical protein NZ556_08400 [Fimbriimonadales bacterium]|nr:hypothetical protein [Fimbriimonadales bacterium]
MAERIIPPLHQPTLRLRDCLRGPASWRWHPTDAPAWHGHLARAAWHGQSCPCLISADADATAWTRLSKPRPAWAKRPSHTSRGTGILPVQRGTDSPVRALVGAEADATDALT